jgi:hypothetical protein
MSSYKHRHKIIPKLLQAMKLLPHYAVHRKKHIENYSFQMHKILGKLPGDHQHQLLACRQGTSASSHPTCEMAQIQEIIHKKSS